MFAKPRRQEYCRNSLPTFHQRFMIFFSYFHDAFNCPSCKYGKFKPTTRKGFGSRFFVFTRLPEGMLKLCWADGWGSGGNVYGSLSCTEPPTGASNITEKYSPIKSNASSSSQKSTTCCKIGDLLILRTNRNPTTVPSYWSTRRRTNKGISTTSNVPMGFVGRNGRDTTICQTFHAPYKMKVQRRRSRTSGYSWHLTWELPALNVEARGNQMIWVEPQISPNTICEIKPFRKP